MIETINRLADLPASDWDALLSAGQPFLRHAFLTSLEDSGAVGSGTGWLPAHLILRDAQGRLVAAAPAYRKSHSYGEYVFDWGWADACRRAGIAYYPKRLTGVPFTPVPGTRLLGGPTALAQLLEAGEVQLAEHGESGWHINFTQPADDVLLAGRTGWLERLGCQFHWFNRGYRDFQDFLDTLSSRKRKQLRKERDQVAGQGIEFEWRDGRQMRETDWDFVHACYARTYQVRGQAPYLPRSLFSLLAERMPDALRVVLARQRGRPVAMAFSLQGDDCLFGRYWGCLAEFDRLHFETCLYQGIDWSIEQRLARFEAGAQGEHKLLRGFEPVLTRSWHYLLHPGLRAAVEGFLEEERAAVTAYLEEARTHLPYKKSL